MSLGRPLTPFAVTPRAASLLLLVASSALLACGDGARATGTTGGEKPDTTDTRPDTQPVLVVSVVAPNKPQLAIIGDAFAFDAARGDSVFRDAVGGGLRYVVTLDASAAAQGLTVSDTRVTGTPSAPGVVTARITATDARDHAATSTFRIVVLSRELPVPTLPTLPFAYAEERAPLPAHFRAPGPGGRVSETDNMPSSNRVTDAGATLGRVLFYDRRLSANDRIACASCHLQEFGFSDTAQFSLGFAGGRTRRHSAPLVNARFYQRGRFFWDERATTLEEQVLQPIQDGVEMGLTLEELEAKVAVSAYYRPLFRDAFGSDTVTADRIALALAQYVRAIVSGQSRLDAAFEGLPPNTPPDFARAFTPQELEGQQLFNGIGKCATCHATWAQVGTDPSNNGLDGTFSDPGAGGGRFKPPSLRNVAVRGRYMHDGRFTSLEGVIDFYLQGVQDSPTLDPRMRGADGRPQRFNLTTAQRDAMVAYLRTLTDPVVLSAEKYSDPFR